MIDNDKRCALTAVALIILHVEIACGIGNKTDAFLPEDAVLNFTELANKYGHTTQEYDVTTEDGYILGLFRIVGSNRPSRRLPVLLMHGLLDSADTWVLRGNESLGITLANAGHDVWCGNSRGNRYSRRHVTLDPDKDPAFWDFSFDELGGYDLASVIDFILTKTGARKLNAVGHSQGTTIFFVLCSTKPVYNQRVNVLIALAPICYLQNVPKPLSKIIQVSPKIYRKTRAIGLVELPGATLGRGLTKLCSNPAVGYAKCVLGITFPFTGADAEQFEPAFFRVSLGHFPMSTSAKNLYHFAQVAFRRSFSWFDYGRTRNLEVYNSDVPPNYDLARVTIPVALIVGRNDRLSVIPDVALLRAQLPNVVGYLEVHRKLMNHIDFVWGRDMRDYLFPTVFEFLWKFD